MKFASIAIGAVLALAFASPIQASDLKVKPRVAAKPEVSNHLCPQGKKIFTEMSVRDIASTISDYHDEAIAVKMSAVNSRSMKFTWAQEASAWCGAAIGYTKWGQIDEEAVAKCACFHYTMIRQ